MSLKDQAFRVAVLGALKDAIASEWAEQRGVLLHELVEAQEQLGVKSLDVSLPDGTKVATVTLTQPHGKPEVVDEAVFTAWVAEHHPTETETTVRPAFRKALLEKVVDDGEGAVWDERTGERVLGVRFRPGVRPNSFSVRYTPEGRAAIGDAWQRGELADYAPPLEVEGATEPRCRHISASPWGPTQCTLPLDHEGRHAYSPSEAIEDMQGGV